MLHALTEWMNGDYAKMTMLSLRVLFFALFVIASFCVCFHGNQTVKGRIKGSGFLVPAFLMVCAIIAIFAYQCKWQLFGTQNVEMMRFLRRHNNRKSFDIRRGSILDRNGSVLAVDKPEINTPGHRHYPLGYACAHVVGYYDLRYGLTGIEKAADDALTGVGASAQDELVDLGRNITGVRRVEGGDVKLTLDARLQRECFKLLGQHHGAVVVMNPDNGEILSLVSAPSFNPLDPGGFYGDAEDAPFLNRAIQGRYPAGSTFKVVMTAIAADLQLHPRFDCPGDGYRAARGAQPIRDSEYYSYKRAGAVWHGFGKIGLKDAFVHSSNVYFAQLAQQIPPSSFNSYVEHLGITSPWTIFASGSGDVTMQPGTLPKVGTEINDEMRKMRAQLAIGQGMMAVSPLHVAMWTSAIASGGNIYPPHLDLERSRAELAPYRVFKASTAGTVGEIMREVVVSGTGKGAGIPGVEICGKTGTAQVPDGDDHSWFTCFTAGTSPKLVVTVIVEHGGYGSKTALPIAKKIVEKALALEIIKKK